MNPLKRNNPGVRATDHEDRIQALERRVASEFPVHAGEMGYQVPNSVAASTTELIGYADPGDTIDTAAGTFEVDAAGEWFMLPVGWEGAFAVYATVAWSGGAVPPNLDDARAFADLEVMEDIAGTWTPAGGGVNAHAYRNYTNYDSAGTPIWSMMFIHAQNNGVGGQDDKRYGVSLYFNNLYTSAITVVGYPVIVQLLEEDAVLPSFG